MSKRLDQLLEFEKGDPNDPFIQFALSKEYEKMGQNVEALDRYLKLREQHPDYIGLYYHLGQLYEVIGDRQNALSIYDEGLELAKSTKDFHAASELNNVKMNLELELGN